MFYANTNIIKWSRVRDAVSFPLVIQNHLRGNRLTARMCNGDYVTMDKRFSYPNSGMARAVLDHVAKNGLTDVTEVTFDIQHRLLTVPQSRAMVEDEMLAAVPNFDLKGWIIHVYDHNGVVGHPELAEKILIPRATMHDDQEMESAYRNIADDPEVLGFFVYSPTNNEYYNLPVRKWLTVEIQPGWKGRDVVVMTGLEDPSYTGRFKLSHTLTLRNALNEYPATHTIQISYSSIAPQADGKKVLFGMRFEGLTYDYELDHQLCGVF